MFIAANDLFLLIKSLPITYGYYPTQAPVPDRI